MKKLADLKGARALNKIEQQSVNGGGRLKPGGGCCNPANDCCVPNNGAPHPGCGQYGNPSCSWLYSPNGCCF